VKVHIKVGTTLLELEQAADSGGWKIGGGDGVAVHIFYRDFDSDAGFDAALRGLRDLAIVAKADEVPCEKVLPKALTEAAYWSDQRRAARAREDAERALPDEAKRRQT
jgi:hypothetical protein